MIFLQFSLVSHVEQVRWNPLKSKQIESNFSERNSEQFPRQSNPEQLMEDPENQNISLLKCKKINKIKCNKIKIIPDYQKNCQKPNAE